MQMELHSNARIPDGLLASMTLLSEKPRLGVPSRESALYPGIDERNCKAILGLRFGWSGIVSGTVDAPSKATQPGQPCSRLNAFNLDYSYLHPDGRTTQQHIIQDHTGGTPNGKSQYRGNFFGVTVLNAVTYLFGTQTVQGTSSVFNFTFPQVLQPLGITYDFGTSPDGTHTASNRVVTAGSCSSVLTSYLVP
jgi:hypothetical protein